MDLSNIQITQDCIVTMVHWGKDIITNVCNSTVTEVPWGIINYVNYTIGNLALLLGLGVIVGLLVIFFFTDN